MSNLAKTIPFFGKKGTAEKFWELAGTHSKFLYNMALRYTANTYDAEDLLQETFYIAFKKFEQLRDQNKLKSWLFSILRNTYLRNRRQNGRIDKREFDEAIDYINVLEEAAERVDIEKAYEQKTESENIQHLLDQLPEKQKSPLLLYYMSGMSYQEISEALDIPIGTVMSRLARGKQMVKKKLLQAY
jgi:RNA polymerase sigma-70 factor (ECF subfamily)